MRHREVLTCKNCGFDNPDGSKKCNQCGITLKEEHFINFWDDKDNYQRRWVCGNCGAKNMYDNKRCHGCDIKR